MKAQSTRLPTPLLQGLKLAALALISLGGQGCVHFVSVIVINRSSRSVTLWDYTSPAIRTEVPGKHYSVIELLVIGGGIDFVEQTVGTGKTREVEVGAFDLPRQKAADDTYVLDIYGSEN